MPCWSAADITLTKKVAHFEGDSEFKGQIIHSHDYRDPRGYEEKRVVVVGIGNSGGDVAVELGKVAKQVYLSTRRGSWIIHRVWDNGLPLDANFSRFRFYYLANILPLSWQNTQYEKQVEAKFDHELYGLKPAHRFFEAHPTLNDDLPNRIISGAVIVKPDIERLTTTGVIFNDGSEVKDIDTIITATGYVFGFPFIDHPALKVKENEVNLYQYVFHPDIEPSGSLAVIGCFQPVGNIGAIAELQARWAIQIIKGNCSLPSKEEMSKEIEMRREHLSKIYYKSSRHTIQLFPVPYQIKISELMGCKPNLLKLWITDPKLAYHVLFDMYTPFQNRLVGPGAWPGAREAIITSMDRVRCPYKTRKPAQNHSETRLWAKIILFGIILLVLAFLWR